MGKILFASNSVSHFPGSSPQNNDWSYDEDRVPYSIFMPPATVASTPLLPASTTQETWFHFRCGSAQWYTNNYEPICEITDVSGDRIAYLSCRDNGSYGYDLFLHTDTQNGYDRKWIPVAQHQMRTFDIHIQHTDILLKATLYINEVKVGEISFSTTSEIVPRFLQIGGHYGTNDQYGAYYSEIIVSDSDTRNARLDLLRPVSAGAYGNWNGPLSSLADDDPTTGMTTTLPNQIQSTILTPYTGANNISNIVQVTTTVRGINSPPKMDHLIRMSGIDYFSPEFDIPYAKDFQVTDWVENPATSQPWAASDLTASEFGFRSKP